MEEMLWLSRSIFGQHHLLKIGNETVSSLSKAREFNEQLTFLIFGHHSSRTRKSQRFISFQRFGPSVCCDHLLLFKPLGVPIGRPMFGTLPKANEPIIWIPGSFGNESIAFIIIIMHSNPPNDRTRALCSAIKLI